ncbi:MAG TPA: cytochrome c [Rhodanobacteraceae bacterium]|jgi:mono/diheme cytochrome c family protein|nr:cytochrome c [Rhodanobacteraceae bacterium]
MKSFLVCCLVGLCFVLSPASRAAELRVDLGHGATEFSTAQLLKRAVDVAIPGDVAFHRTMHYRAVPLLSLLPGLQRGQHLQFVARDGFTAEIPAAALLNTKGSKAWVAIEDPAHPWPPIAENPNGAGPFYLVWTDPQAAHINQEQWPFQLASIRALSGVDARFPAIVPDSSVAVDSEVRHGFEVFKRTCFACHTMNGEGDSRLGPDLNIPYNPTEYLRADLLRAYIRNPQSLRHWPEARMAGFPTQASLSDADLDAVLDYLRYMARHKVTH